MRRPVYWRHVLTCAAVLFGALFVLNIAYPALTPSIWHAGQSQAWVGVVMKLPFTVAIGVVFGRLLRWTWTQKVERWAEYERSMKR